MYGSVLLLVELCHSYPKITRPSLEIVSPESSRLGFPENIDRLHLWPFNKPMPCNGLLLPLLLDVFPNFGPILESDSSLAVASLY